MQELPDQEMNFNSTSHTALILKLIIISAPFYFIGANLESSVELLRSTFT